MQNYPPNQPPQPPYPPQQPSLPPPPSNYTPPTGSTPPLPDQGWQPGQMPQQPYQPMLPRKKSRKKLWITLGVIFLILVIIGALNSHSSDGQATATPNAQSASQSQSQATQAPSTPQPTPTPKPTFATINDGTWQVGKDVKSGTYRTREASPGCYWARLRGFGGGVDDIIANENPSGPAVVTIAAGDKGFQSQNCGTWTKDLSRITASKTSFDEGTYIVGTDIEPGTYKSSGQEGCYWARLRGFGGGVDDIVANDNPTGTAIVTISSSDKGFTSARCGTWTKM